MSKRMWTMSLAAALVMVTAAGWAMAQGHAPTPPPGAEHVAPPAAPDDDALMGDDEGLDGGLFALDDEGDAPAPPGPGRHGAMMRGMKSHGGMEGLDLTKAQRDRMADIHDRTMRQAIRSRADLQLARLDLHKVLRAGAPNKAAIDLQIDRIARMRADLQKSHVAAMLEARSVLTDEQRQKLRERHGDRWGMRMRIRERLQHRHLRGEGLMDGPREGSL